MTSTMEFDAKYEDDWNSFSKEVPVNSCITQMGGVDRDLWGAT